MSPLIRAQALTDQAAHHLREAILSGRYRPGERMIQQQLAAELGISRTPLREALHKLEEEGLVRITPSRGIEVVNLNQKELLDMYEVREVIDGLAARLAAEHAQKKDCKAVEESISAMAAAIDDWNPNAWLTSNVQFHQAVIEATGNKTLLQQLPMVRMTAQMFYPVVYVHPERARHALEEHKAILACIRSGKPEEAERLARGHINMAKQFLREHPRT